MVACDGEHIALVLCRVYISPVKYIANITLMVHAFDAESESEAEAKVEAYLDLITNEMEKVEVVREHEMVWGDVDYIVSAEGDIA